MFGPRARSQASNRAEAQSESALGPTLSSGQQSVGRTSSIDGEARVQEFFSLPDPSRGTEGSAGVNRFSRTFCKAAGFRGMILPHAQAACLLPGLQDTHVSRHIIPVTVTRFDWKPLYFMHWSVLLDPGQVPNLLRHARAGPSVHALRCSAHREQTSGSASHHTLGMVSFRVCVLAFQPADHD